MAKQQCKSCNGIYDDIGADGVRYFHACAPVGVDVAGAPIERANKRDENVMPGFVNGQTVMVPKADGGGVVKL